MKNDYSVIIPVYNGSAVLENTVLSAINQTVKAKEIIIIDDCSTDNTYKIMENLADKYENIKIFKNDKNINVAKTRNKGFKLATNDFVALLDADDCWLPRKMEKQLTLMNKTNCDLSYTGYSLVDEDGINYGKDYEVPETLHINDLLKENFIGCSTVVMKKEVTEKFQMSSLYSHEDYVFWLTLLIDNKTALGINKPLMKYKVAKNSRSGDKKKAAKNRWIIYRRFLKMNIFKSIYYFSIYAIRGISKHI